MLEYLPNLVPEFLIPSGDFLRIVFQLAFVFYALRVLKFIYGTFLRPCKDLLKRYGKDSYVLITGATDGIGKGHAMAWGKRGFNLIIVSRTQSKLEKVRNEILEMTKNSIKVEIISYDFSNKITLKDYQDTFNPVIAKFDISVLVNNVGISHEDYTFRIQDDQEIINYINVNNISQSILTKFLMDKLSKRQYKSAILSMSSLAASCPYSGNAIYSATKAFNDYLSRSLFGEYGFEKGNIDFLSIRPSYVESNMSEMKSDGFDVVSVNHHVESVLGELGHTEVTYGSWSHKLPGWFLNSVPEFYRRQLLHEAKLTEEKLQKRHKK